jgi:hypothetical protein
MRERGIRQTQQIRRQISQHAAQLLMEDGELTFSAARRKAAERLGGVRGRDLPEYAEIEAALIEHRRIFGGETLEEQLRELRQQALAAMRFLTPFEPLLVGRVLSGTTGRNAKIALHVFADTAEEVLHFLHERDVPAVLGERHYAHAERYPLIDFLAGTVRLELVVFPLNRRHHAPLSEITGKPMLRANVDAVRALIGQPAALPAAS